MAVYLRTLLNGGQGAEGRIVSAEGFRLMSTPYIKAPEFSPGASYGYGIAVDVLDGHKILRHTGGMNCFASSIHVDLDGGVAAFASINAMQGYRPTLVTQYAVQLLRAQKEAKPLPAAIVLSDATEVNNASEYAGTFRSSGGAELLFKADGTKLLLLYAGKEILLQRGQGDTFLSTVQGVFSDYSLVFGRDRGSSKMAKPADNDAAPPPPPTLVVEVGYGPDWYTNGAYEGEREWAAPPQYSAFSGRFEARAATIYASSSARIGFGWAILR